MYQEPCLFSIRYLYALPVSFMVLKVCRRGLRFFYSNTSRNWRPHTSARAHTRYILVYVFSLEPSLIMYAYISISLLFLCVLTFCKTVQFDLVIVGFFAYTLTKFLMLLEIYAFLSNSYIIAWNSHSMAMFLLEWAFSSLLDLQCLLSFALFLCQVSWSIFVFSVF